MEHLQTIQQIFNARFLCVADYQRGYAWEGKHWKALMEDLDLLEVGSEHYTGTLVLHHVEGTPSRMDDEGQEHGVYDIVDGQQRITTIVLLLDALRRELPVESAALAEGIKKTYLVTKVDGQPCYKLTLNPDTREFFEDNILAEKPGIQGPQIRSQRLLKEAHTSIREHLHAEKTQRGDSGKDWLIALYKKITNGLKVTVYEVPRASDVGVIFEVMNNRGKPLSEMEKVKNYLLYLVSKVNVVAAQKVAYKINRTWREVFEGLMQSEASGLFYEDQLLRTHWLTVYDHRPKNWSGYDSVKELLSLRKYLGRGDELIAAIDNYITTLSDFSHAYCDLIAPWRTGAFSQYRDDSARQKPLQLATEKLVRLDALATFLPLLTAVRLAHSGDADLYRSFLEVCEKYAARVFRFAKRRSNAGQTSLFKLGNDVYHTRVTPESALTSIVGLLLFYAPADEFRSGLEAPSDWYSSYGLKYFLYEYEEHLANGKKVQLPWEHLTRTDKKDSIEHILPQTPTDPYWVARWSPEAIRSHLHDIGNLSLTYDNSSYGKKAFPQKRGVAGGDTCYANSNLFMERELSKHQDWTPKECDARRSEIIAWALKRWDVAAPASAIAQVDILDDEDAE